MKDFSSRYTFTREDYLTIIAARDDHFAPEERETVIGTSDASPYWTIDIFLSAANIKYVLKYNALCASGRGTMVEADDNHVIYHIDKDAINPFCIRHTKDLTAEQRETLRHLMAAARQLKKP